MPPNNQTQLDQDAVNLSKAIRQVESGGNFTAKGKSGEYGAYQYTEPTWNAYAKKHGVAAKLSDATPEQQNEVTYKQIKEWKDKGYNPGQIASMWNSGKPDAYLDSTYTGTNKSGVKFDVPAYAKSVATAYHTIKGGGSPGMDPLNPSASITPTPDKGFMGNVGDALSNRLGQAGTAITNTLSGKINPLSGVLQTVGAGAGAVGDVLGEGLKLIPGVKQAESALGQGIGKLANTSVGQKVVSGVQGFSEAHPELSADIGAVGNIAGLVGGGVGAKVGKDVVKQGVYTAAKKGLIGAGAKGLVEKSALKSATKILETAPTTREVGSAVRGGRLATKKGLVSMAPDPMKQASINEIAPLVKEGIVVPGKAAENAIAIKGVADQTAEEMRRLIKTQDVQNVLQPEQLQTMAQKVIARSSEGITSGENPAQILLNVFYKKLPKSGDITAESVLDARQAVSKFVLENKGDWTMKGQMTGFKTARDAFWDESRTLLADLAPNVPVRELLAKQTALYRALDYLPAAIKKELTAEQKGMIASYFSRHPIQAFIGKKVGGGVAAGVGALVGLPALKNFVD